MIPLRLGTRIMLWSALVVALGMLLCGVAITAFIREQRVGQLDREFTAEAGHFLNELRLHGGSKFDWVNQAQEPREWSPGAHPPHYVEVVNPQGVTLFRTSGMPAGSWERHVPGFRDIHIDGIQMRLATFEGQEVTLYLLASYGAIDDLSRDLTFAFLCAVPVMLLFTALGSRWIARQAVSPIQQIIESAEHITTERLDQRLPVPTAHDEIHRLVTVLNHTLDRLDRGFRQATRFTADASHELKTPLTVMRTSVEALLRSPALSSADQRAVEELLDQTKRLSAITVSLLLLSRADVGKLTLDLLPGDLLDVVGPCVEDGRIMADAKAILIHVEAPPQAPALLDASKASQIVMNLLDNAIKFNRPGGEVWVRLVAGNEGEWRLRVTNTGSGLRSESVGQLFTRFYRGEHTAPISGHGLGLSISLELARAHGGDLEFEGSQGGLTTFTWKIPRRKVA